MVPLVLSNAYMYITAYVCVCSVSGGFTTAHLIQYSADRNK